MNSCRYAAYKKKYIILVMVCVLGAAGVSYALWRMYRKGMHDGISVSFALAMSPGRLIAVSHGGSFPPALRQYLQSEEACRDRATIAWVLRLAGWQGAMTAVLDFHDLHLVSEFDDKVASHLLSAWSAGSLSTEGAGDILLTLQWVKYQRSSPVMLEILCDRDSPVAASWRAVALKFFEAAITRGKCDLMLPTPHGTLEEVLIGYMQSGTDVEKRIAAEVLAKAGQRQSLRPLLREYFTNSSSRSAVHEVLSPEDIKSILCGETTSEEYSWDRVAGRYAKVPAGAH